MKLRVSLVYFSLYNLLIEILAYSVLECLIYFNMFVLSSTTLASVLFQVDEITSFDLYIIYLINDFIKFGSGPNVIRKRGNDVDLVRLPMRGDEDRSITRDRAGII